MGGAEHQEGINLVFPLEGGCDVIVVLPAVSDQCSSGGGGSPVQGHS